MVLFHLIFDFLGEVLLSIFSYFFFPFSHFWGFVLRIALEGVGGVGGYSVLSAVVGVGGGVAI